MAGRGTRATAVDFNNIQSIANNVLGVGSGTSGYGQTVLSSPSSPGGLISSTAWTNLRTDLSKSRVHQTNIAVVDGAAQDGQTLRVITPSTTITEDIRAQYDAFATTVNANRALSAAGQKTADVTLVTATRSAAWGGATDSISHTVTVTFAGYGSVSAADHARVFFNAGGSIDFLASLAGGTGAKYDDWTDMFTSPQGVGKIRFATSSTSVTGAVNAGGSVGSAIGFSTLTIGAAAVNILTQTSSVSSYSANRFLITAARPTANALSFVLTYNDAAAGTIDEEVSGTLTSATTCTQPTGANVSVPAPTATTSAL
jgi:hypothetical protein